MTKCASCSTSSGLTFGYQPKDAGPFIAMLDRMLAAGKASVAAGHQRMLRDKVNVAAWYTDFIEKVGHEQAARSSS